MGVSFAGSGTTSTTLFYLRYRMSLPEATRCQDKLHGELRQAKAGGRIGLKQAQDLPWLNAIVKETMRLHPTIISTLPRVLQKDVAVTLGDGRTVVFPRGSKVGMQNYVHHRDPELFPEPDKFLPERWLGETTGNLQNMALGLTPFSLGPRNCIGQNLAKAELLLCVSEIFGRLRLRLGKEMTADDLEMEDRFNIAPRGEEITAQRGDGLKFGFQHS